MKKSLFYFLVVTLCFIAFSGICYASHGLGQNMSKTTNEGCYLQDPTALSKHENFYGFYGDIDFPYAEVKRMQHLFYKMLSMHENLAMEDMICPKIDVVESDDDFIVTCDIPGIQKDEIDIRLNHTWLTIEGKRVYSKENEKTKKDNHYYVQEIGYGAFQRMVHVPNDVCEEEITATYKDGVLSITLPKEKNSSKRGEYKIEVL